MSRFRLPAAVVVAMAVSAGMAQAAALPGALSVTASVTLDTTNSSVPVGDATQSVTLRHVAAGAPTTSIGDLSTISPASLAGTLSATGDGVGALFAMSGTNPGEPATTDGLYADFLISLANTSATDTFVVVIRALFGNGVTAAGDDAFAYSDVSVRDAANNEVLFSDHRADTLNTGQNFSLDSTTPTFFLTLNPGDSTTVSALQRQRGGAFLEGSSYSASLDAFLSIDEVICRGPCGSATPVPLPGTLPLLTLALAVPGLWRRRARA